MKKLVGLTGKTGAGKSTVSALLKEKGAYIIDGDIVARKVFDIDETILPKLIAAFGDILNEDNSVNRKLLAQKAFSSPENTQLLNSVMHPAINNIIKTQADNAFGKYDVVIVDAAAIIESGFADECDMLVVVTAPLEIRKQRIISRDSLSETDAMIRINGQKDDSFYLSKADFVINNNGNKNELKQQLEQLEKELFSVERKK